MQRPRLDSDHRKAKIFMKNETQATTIDTSNITQAVRDQIIRDAENTSYITWLDERYYQRRFSEAIISWKPETGSRKYPGCLRDEWFEWLTEPEKQEARCMATEYGLSIA
jgi:hypothetical protein